MAKSPEKRLLEVTPNDNTNPREPEAEPSDEDSWVIVKKQIVNILIPPLPITIESTAPNLVSIQLESTDTNLQMPPVEDSEKSVPSDFKKDSPAVPRSPQPVAPLGKLPRAENRMRSEYPVQDGFRCRNALRVHNSSRISKKPSASIDRCMLLTPRMRASNIEKKLKRAGGLSPWLASLGLDRFNKIFHGKRVSKFQLVNLTMKKLKDMGVEAVGPRRKLMHAIDCLREPYCFKAL